MILFVDEQSCGVASVMDEGVRQCNGPNGGGQVSLGSINAEENQNFCVVLELIYPWHLVPKGQLVGLAHPKTIGR